MQPALDPAQIDARPERMTRNGHISETAFHCVWTSPIVNTWVAMKKTARLRRGFSHRDLHSAI